VAVGGHDREALFGEPLGLQVHGSGLDHLLMVGAAVGGHQHRELRAGLVPGGEQHGGADAVRSGLEDLRRGHGEIRIQGARGDDRGLVDLHVDAAVVQRPAGDHGGAACRGGGVHAGAGRDLDEAVGAVTPDAGLGRIL
jgi:hypothetical protein